MKIIKKTIESLFGITITIAAVKYLKDNDLSFVIRLRDKNYNDAINATGKPIEKLERRAKKRLGQAFSKHFDLNGESYFFVFTAYKDRNGKISDRRSGDTATNYNLSLCK